MRVFIVIEDDPDVQFLIETVFSEDGRFSVGGVSSIAEEAFDMARSTEPGSIVLDHGLTSALPVLAAVAGRARLVAA